MADEFRIIGDDLYFMGELYAKIVMPPSIIRDKAENRLDWASEANTRDYDSFSEMIGAKRSEAFDEGASAFQDEVEKILETHAQEKPDHESVVAELTEKIFSITVSIS